MMFGREHIIVVAALLVNVVLITVYALGQNSAAELPVLSPNAVSVLIMAVSPGPAASASHGPVRVHVLEAAVRPGVVSTQEGATVQDATETTGGLVSGADPGELNLATPAKDGQQAIVGTSESPHGEVVDPGGGSPAMGSTAAAEAKLVNLNRATLQQLQELPGIGPVLAEAIIRWCIDDDSLIDVS